MHYDSQLVFVYGTLRRGGANHRLLAGSRMLEYMETDDIYTMYDLGDYPAIVQNGKCSIVGETYAISTEILAMLDELEECPDYYQRILINTSYGKAWIYVLAKIPDGSICVIESGDWLLHTTGRGHHLR